MTHPSQDDWSDSDDEASSGVETSVLLGVPDGPMDIPSNITDAAVSRIGGHPAFLPSPEPPITSSCCKVCENPMELLVQIWCPFEDSPMDRALYVWGCSRIGCQKKHGSVRVWRGLRYNEKYAAKLEKKLARKQPKRDDNVSSKTDRTEEASKTNPFSGGAAPGFATFGLGTQIFGTQVRGTSVADTVDPDEEQVSNDDGDESDASEESLLMAMTKATVSDSPWQAAPAYPPIYLSTVSEYLPPEPKLKAPFNAQIIDPSIDSKGDSSWMTERYENSLEIDPVFGRFMRRVAAEGEQCIRYELNGVPLPFASDEVLDQLFPMPQKEPLPVTKPDFKVVQASKRTYDPSVVPRCPVCKSKRVFECQLMPNLINVVKSRDKVARKMAEEERRKEIERILRGGKAEEKGGMEWGTCIVFSCSQDCCEEGTDGWREEVVYVQWDV